MHSASRIFGSQRCTPSKQASSGGRSRPRRARPRPRAAPLRGGRRGPSRCRRGRGGQGSQGLCRGRQCRPAGLLGGAGAEPDLDEALGRGLPLRDAGPSVVHRRAHQHLDQLPGSPCAGGARRCQGHDLRLGKRRRARLHLCRGAGRGLPHRQRAEKPGRRPRRPGGHLHAADPGRRVLDAARFQLRSRPGAGRRSADARTR